MRLTTPARNWFTPNLDFTRLAIVFSASVMLFNFAPSAVADTVTTYHIIFTAIEGPTPTAGSFTYNSTTPGFSDFTVVYNGVIFDFTADANHPNNHASSGNCSPSDPNTGWLIISHACDSSSGDYWSVSPCCNIDSVFTFLDTNGIEGAAIDAEVIPPQPTETDDNVTSQGSWALSPRSSNTSVPEPGTRVLLATALGAGAIFARKRIVRGVR
jgi:hypothetical protein